MEEKQMLEGGAARPTRLRRNEGKEDWSLAWLDDAACADLSIDDFYVKAGDAITETNLNICRTCPVRVQCLEHAYEMGITGGYFGGMSPGQRRALALERAREFISTDGPQPLRNVPIRRRVKAGAE
jgi:WhiB family redox-sensing transcriptional regulator